MYKKLLTIFLWNALCCAAEQQLTQELRILEGELQRLQELLNRAEGARPVVFPPSPPPQTEPSFGQLLFAREKPIVYRGFKHIDKEGFKNLIAMRNEEQESLKKFMEELVKEKSIDVQKQKIFAALGRKLIDSQYRAFIEGWRLWIRDEYSFDELNKLIGSNIYVSYGSAPEASKFRDFVKLLTNEEAKKVAEDLQNAGDLYFFRNPLTYLYNTSFINMIPNFQFEGIYGQSLLSKLHDTRYQKEYEEVLKLMQSFSQHMTQQAPQQFEPARPTSQKEIPVEAPSSKLGGVPFVREQRLPQNISYNDLETLIKQRNKEHENFAKHIKTLLEKSDVSESELRQIMQQGDASVELTYQGFIQLFRWFIRYPTQSAGLENLFNIPLFEWYESRNSPLQKLIEKVKDKKLQQELKSFANKMYYFGHTLQLRRNPESWLVNLDLIPYLKFEGIYQEPTLKDTLEKYGSIKYSDLQQKGLVK